MEMFEKATKLKLRFNFKGTLTVEDLWDLKLNELDTIYKDLNQQKKLQEEESLLKNNLTNDIVNLQIEIIKYIVERKQAEQLARQTQIEKRQQKQKILEILSRKQDDDLQNKSTEDLLKMLENL
jgi:hypothetical protein